MPCSEFGRWLHPGAGFRGAHDRDQSWCVSFRRRDRQCELKARAGIERALRPNATAMARYDAMHDRQSHAGTREILRSVQPLENPEQPVRVTHVETGAIVLHLINRLAIFDPTADLDPRLRPLRTVFQGVADEVAPDLTNHRRISRGRRQLGNLDV